MAWNVVIAGGGFGGFYAARTLERTMPPASTRITLVSDVNFMLYTPLLPGAAAGTPPPPGRQAPQPAPPPRRRAAARGARAHRPADRDDRRRRPRPPDRPRRGA